MNRESACGLVILACLGMAACGPEGLEAQQGHEEEALLRAARSEARGMQRWSKSETSLEVCPWNEQGLDAVAFVTDEEDSITAARDWQYVPW